MGDRKSSKKSQGHIKKHLKLTITSSEDLKDEAYVQVLKQIKEHKEQDKALKGWSFLAILASCYIPSMRLFYSILNYLLFEIKNNKNKDIVTRANYVFVRLYRTYETGRKNIPSDNELTHIENMKPITIPIHFFSNTCTNVEIESYTTVRELKTTLMKKLQFNISRIPYYSLYEICNKKDLVEERFLEEDERVCDVLAVWDKEIEQFSKNKEQIEFKIYLKIMLYYPYTENDIDTVTAVYTQSVHDISNGKFKLTEEDIITLASLQLLVEFGTNQDQAYSNLQKKLDRFIPYNQVNLNPSVYWIQKIMELYSGLKASSKLEAKLTYIEQIKSSPLWEAHQFPAKVKILLL
jgi:myosin VIIa